MRTTNSTITGSFTEQALLPRLINDAITDGNAITLWRMPHSAEKHLLICTDGVSPLDELSLEESKTGFVFSPFDPAGKKMFFRGNVIHTFLNGQLESDTLPEQLFQKKAISDKQDQTVKTKFPVLESDTTPPADYRELVKKSIDAIREGYFEKVVPSRRKLVELSPSFDLVKSFGNLCEAYPDAFVSLVSSEETGTWLGASPELIVSIDQHRIFRTVALAGTQRYQPEINPSDATWTDKEIEEQALVGRYIISCFKKIRVREYEESGPRTSVAGNLLHLKTDYRVDTAAINFPQLGSVMLKLLHPTSAVCGMPLENAMNFLKAGEGYDREYYSGFLGPVNFRNESHVYVNLRCMQLLNKKAFLYAGAGVTVDSIPEKEWEETGMKLEMLLKVAEGR